MSGARRTAGNTDTMLVFAAITLAVLAVGNLWAVLHVAAWLGHQPPPPNQPVQLLADLIKGQIRWPRYGLLILGGQLAALLLVGVLGWFIWRTVHRRRPRLRGDRAAALMGTGKDLEAVSGRSVKAAAERLGVTGSFGLKIAETVTAPRSLWQSWEDVSVDIWGPRQGKTTSRVIPAIVSAPGAVVVTSNKRDVVDATRGVREPTGPVWVFDPQGICGEPPTWWWNPLGGIGDEVDAQKLAAIFVAASRPAGARTDAYFDGAGEDLLAGLILAAAVARRPVTQVYLWLTRPTDTEPAILLEQAGFALVAAGVRNVIDAPDKQRGGVYGTAQRVVNFMTNSAAMTWCTPGTGQARPQFHPDQFVSDGLQTLYSISKEGQGSAGPVVTALTAAVTEAAERLSERSPLGRLPIPMVLVLDEAANVCRWTELPNLYSHFGSRGIVVLTILQSWAQGVEVWGREGMIKLWAAATVKVVGSGVGGGEFLQELSTLIGDWDAPHTSRTTGRSSGPSYNHSRQRERIMDVADIAALPKGRCIVHAAGTRPALCRTLPWMTGPQAEAVSASIRQYDPNTLAAPVGQPAAATWAVPLDQIGTAR